MIILFLIWLMIISLCDIVSDAGSVSTLRLLQLVWRHGDRTPIDYIPSDVKNAPSTWPQGVGELTPLGMLQHYQTGQFLRKYYVEQAKFLSPSYSTNEIYVRSTDYNRTIQSAVANLAGFYPSDGFGVKGLKWAPIPVHTASNNSLMKGPKVCPYYHQLLNQLYQSPVWLERQTERQDFYNWLSRVTEFPSPINDTNVDKLYDSLNAEKIHHREWPGFVNQSIFDKIIQYAFADTLIPQRFKRYQIGFLTNELVNRMMNKARELDDSDPNPRLKMLIYSGHDTTVMPLLKSLGVFNDVLPPYASIVIFELHRIDTRYFVKIMFRNTTTDYLTAMPRVLKIEGCSAKLCPLEEFVERSQPYIMTFDNYPRECHLKGAFAPSERTYKVLTLILSLCCVVLTILLSIAICYIVRRRRQLDRYGRYKRIAVE